MSSRPSRGLPAAALVVAVCLPLSSCTSSSGTSTSASAVPVTSTVPQSSAPMVTAVRSTAVTSTPAAVSPSMSPDPTSPVASSRGAGVPTVVSTASTGSPQGAAVAWFTALRTASFRDASTAWIQKVAPYVTPAMAAAYRKVGADGKGGGADWASFVAEQCVSVVVNAAGVIPAEAPVTTTAAHVQVSATLTTACRTGSRASSEFIAATVLVTNQHGSWKVAKREF